MKNKRKITKEFKFRIEICGRENEFHHIKRILNERLFEYLDKPQKKSSLKNDYSNNNIYDFIQFKVGKYFRDYPDIKVYLANYREKKGSYILEFSVIAIALVSQYGSIRSGIDYLKMDIKSLFKKFLNHNCIIETNHNEIELSNSQGEAINSGQLEIDNLQSSTNNLIREQVDQNRKLIRANIILTGITALLCLLTLFGGNFDINFDESETYVKGKPELFNPSLIKELQSGKDYIIIDNDEDKEYIKLKSGREIDTIIH